MRRGGGDLLDAVLERALEVIMVYSISMLNTSGAELAVFAERESNLSFGQRGGDQLKAVDDVF